METDKNKNLPKYNVFQFSPQLPWPHEIDFSFILFLSEYQLNDHLLLQCIWTSTASQKLLTAFSAEC